MPENAFTIRKALGGLGIQCADSLNVVARKHRRSGKLSALRHGSSVDLVKLGWQLLSIIFACSCLSCPKVQETGKSVKHKNWYFLKKSSKSCVVRTLRTPPFFEALAGASGFKHFVMRLGSSERRRRRRFSGQRHHRPVLLPWQC